jgi:uncharacterized protein (UPF0261 family)
MKKIAIVVTLDTKSEEAAYLKGLIGSYGHQTLIVDIGCGGEPGLVADISSAEIAQAAGTSIDKLRTCRNRESVSESMIAGAVIELRALCRQDQLEGVVSIGGISSAVMASNIMSEVPYMIPKLILSSGASQPGCHRWFGPTGITVMHCLVDVGGLNCLLKEHLTRAAAVICAMVDANRTLPKGTGNKPLIAMSSNSWVEHSGHLIFARLEPKYEVIRFLAAGAPEVFMEHLIEEGYFAAVIDLVPSSITNERFGGSRISWPRRMEIAGQKGVPQVIAPCLVNVISRMRDDSEAQALELKARRHYFIDRQRVLLWLNTEELKDIAAIYAEKLNKATGPTVFLVPLKGWLTIETEESEFWDAKAVKGFAGALKKRVKPGIEIREVNANIDSAAFAEAVVDAFSQVIGQRGQKRQTVAVHH